MNVLGTWETIVEEWEGKISADAIAEAVKLAGQAFHDHVDEYIPAGAYSRMIILDEHVPPIELASFVRRVLRHPVFDTQAKRMGSVIRLSHTGLSAWRLRLQLEENYEWSP